MAETRILVVDDDHEVAEKVRKLLTREGYAVDCVGDGDAALKRIVQFEPNLVILDITLPFARDEKDGLDGIDILRRVREEYETPVLMLSATSVGAVKVMALTMGADDYLTKPFNPQELLARVGAILRRARNSIPGDGTLEFEGLRIEPQTRRVWKGESPVDLTVIEFELLYTLARRPGLIFSRDQLIENAWKHSYYGVPKVVDVHIGHIRRKIEDDPTAPRYIVTVRGLGYRFEGNALKT
ncbi:MAG: response regulator transcription factor [Candidatus Hydrogenedentes bacterium]|nr:response regulator transcription factor [Candidatus Hydrogenedentota bacterium]